MRIVNHITESELQQYMRAVEHNLKNIKFLAEEELDFQLPTSWTLFLQHYLHIK